MSMSLFTNLPFSLTSSQSNTHKSHIPIKQTAPQQTRTTNNNHQHHLSLLVHTAKEENHLITNRRGALLGLGLLTGLLPGIAKAAPPPEPLSEFGPDPRPLNSTIRVLVPRPPKPSTYREDENVLVLTVDGVEVKDNDPVRLDVYVAKPDEGQVGYDDLGEFAGNLIDLARLRSGRRARKIDLNLGITSLVKEIGAEKCEKLLVSLVPRTGVMVVDGVHIENFKAE
ncbi:hypothetical protein Sjap_000140 [Stephania japonica]|uniref:Polyphenol oxidase C-terminal domain-containing protein n=1 Tax=Stephania japonica TaxID=461633 RepID=A0AAP0KIE8_9MAGN